MEIAIIMQFIQAIMECIQERRIETIEEAAEQVHGRLVDESRRARRGVFRGIINMIRKDEGLRGRDLRDAAFDAFGMLKESNAEDVASLIGDAVCAIRMMDGDLELTIEAAVALAMGSREDGQ